MRSQKSRSRNKSNRNRPSSSGNIVNRVFDSSGPESKVRGTPQQIIDKYNQLARDAQLSNDRVAAENFQQHAEHYMRMLSEAQREMDTRREEQERQNRERQADRDRERQDRMERQEREANSGSNNSGNNNSNHSNHNAQQRGSSDPSEAPQPDVIAVDDGQASGLVETPEAKAEDKPKTRRPRRKPAPKKDTDGAGSDAAPVAAVAPDNPEAAE